MQNCDGMRQVFYHSCTKCYTFIDGDVNSTVKCALPHLPAPIATYLYLHAVILPFILQIFVMQPP